MGKYLRICTVLPSIKIKTVKILFWGQTQLQKPLLKNMVCPFQVPFIMCLNLTINGRCARSKFQETGVLTHFAQKFKTHISRGGEVFTGLGVRKKWTGDAFDGALTGIYEVGMKSGNGKTRVQAATVARPNAVINLSGETPGKVTHYLSLLGAVEQKNSWKVIPSVTGTFQNNQNSFMFALKVEKTF